MSISIIITLCVLLLLAYAFDISSSKTRIPSVILLLLLGWAVRQTTVFLKIEIPDLTSVLPVLGTIGLIMIVLEGSLELELNKGKLPFVGKSVLLALLPMVAISFSLAAAFCYYDEVDLKTGLSNAIPFAVISSAIAIPSVQNLVSGNREFIIYESSLSDIFGVIFFNFITLNEFIDIFSFSNFFFEFILILLITFVATALLAFLLSKINHHIKYGPIILMTILIYAAAKYYHLPALIFILLFGLFLKNLDELTQIKFLQKLKPEILDVEVGKLGELTAEFAFLIRALFFLLFGYLIETAELLNRETMVWAAGITAGIFVFRVIFLKIFNLNLNPIAYIAPRGLITILLFLSIPLNSQIPSANKSLIIQVIILTALVMMMGLIQNKKNAQEVTTHSTNQPF
ncbi:MAG: sodium:proton antiporter [Saprospiraceae bacterium]|nr:sodium:proton antiporter [Saprospiraceae bacterium]